MQQSMDEQERLQKKQKDTLNLLQERLDQWTLQQGMDYYRIDTNTEALGNCLFDALRITLNAADIYRSRRTNAVQDIRSAIVNYVASIVKRASGRRTNEALKKFVQERYLNSIVPDLKDLIGRTPKDNEDPAALWIQEMSKNNVWGDQTVLVAATDLFKVRLVVITDTLPDPQIYEPMTEYRTLDPKATLVITNYENIHFMACVPDDERRRAYQV